MKKMFLVVAVIAASVFTLTAQPKSEGDKAAYKAKMEEMMNVRLQMLTDELKLSEAQATAFAPVYREYRKDISRVADKRRVNVKREELTNENALKVVAARLANTINTASVKQKYLWIFAEVIEPLQIEKLYRVDDRIAREARKIAHYKK
jgi:hypothetical protein